MTSIQETRGFPEAVVGTCQPPDSAPPRSGIGYRQGHSLGVEVARHCRRA